MKPTHYKSIRTALGLILILSADFGLSSCSTKETATRQQGITDVHQSMIDRRETRQRARDERFSASRESLMN